MTILKKTERYGWFLPPLLLGVGRILFDFDIAFGLMLGSLWMVLNFFFTRKLIERFFDSKKTGQVFVALLASIKLFILLGLAYWVLNYMPVHDLAFALGVMIVVMEVSTVILINQRGVLSQT